jgi:alanine dehydrogenase
MLIGIIASSTKKNEKRYPLHYQHINELDEEECKQLIFEEGYPHLDKIKHHESLVIASRKEVFDKADLVIIPKPTKNDFPFFKERQIIWGWPHCVQGKAITEEGIKKKLTYIAFENMYKWQKEEKGRHIFARNNELAGYASVIHAFSSLGLTAGIYGPAFKTAVIGYGSTGRGAISALRGLGANDITVFTRRSKFELTDALPGVKFRRYSQSKDGKTIMDEKPAYEALSEYDVIVNCILQNPLHPITFLNRSDALQMRHSLLIIDVSSDEKMGFDFAHPTGFDQPSFEVGRVTYFAVNHSPTYFYESASYEISGALFPFLKYIINHGTYKGNVTLERAVDIEEGKITNKAIIEYQHREKNYPYKVIVK